MYGLRLVIFVLCISVVGWAFAYDGGWPGRGSKSSVVGGYLSGEYAIRNKDVEAAAEIFLEALEKQPENEVLLDRSYKLLLALGKIKKAVRLLEEAGVSEVDPAASVLLSTYYAKKGDFSRSLKILDAMRDVNDGSVVSNFNRAVLPLLKVWLKVGEENYAGALELLNQLKIDKEIPGVFLLYQSALINDYIGEHDEARKDFGFVVSSGSVLPYHFVRAAGNFYERLGSSEKAKTLYDNYKLLNSKITHFVSELERIEKGRVPKPLIKSALGGINEVMLEAVRVLYNGGFYDEGLAYLQLALFLKESDEGRVLLASYYEKDQNLSDAIKHYKKIDRDSDFYLVSRLAMAENLYMMDKKRKAVKQLRKLEKLYPDVDVTVLTLAHLLQRDEKFDEAALEYSKVLEKRGELSLKDWPMLFARGICYERSGKWKLAEADLQKALELKPNQPEVLNYLAYSWIDRDENLLKAKDMVENAVKSRPNDAQIIDSVGWAFYKMNDFERAKNFLERAVEIIPYDTVINDHLGDVYWRLGRYNEARFQWQRVLDYKDGEVSVEKLQDKLDNGLPLLVGAEE